MDTRQTIYKEFEELLMELDVRHFLKASPLEAGERSRMDVALSEAYYFDHLYAHSEEAEKLINDIQNEIRCEDTHNFILSGYKGCGKSTFVRYFLRRLNLRNLTINFDNNWEPDIGIINNIAAFLDKLIYDDLFPQNGEEPCRVVKKYIELFCCNKENKYLVHNIDTKNYFIYFGDKIEFALLCKNSGQEEKLRHYFDTDIKSHIISGTISNVMMLILFWDIANRITNSWSEKCCIVFENLDVIYNTKDIPNLVSNVLAFRNNIDRLVTSLTYEGKSIGNPTQDYMLMFIMRETTKSEFSSYIDHFSDGKIRFKPFTKMGEIYNIHSIISQRISCLDELSKEYPEYMKNDNFIHTIKTSKLIQKILKDSYLQKKFFALFNNDYRTSVEMLASFNLEDRKFFLSCERLLELSEKEDDEWSAFGFRSIVFRAIFNVFVKEGYISRLRNFEYSVKNDGIVKGINLDRMILLYLSNSVTNKEVPEEEKDLQFVPLDRLFIEIKKFCNNSKFIVDALWQMYDLRKAKKWNHLVTFDNMQTITYEELRRQLTALEENKTDIDFARVKITLAGEVYLYHVLPHFEFYGARAENGAGYSIFSFTAEELCNLAIVNSVLKKQKKEIKDCCLRLYGFFQDVFNVIPEFNEENFLKSDFVAIKYSKTRKSTSKMYHCERIIHANIGYINRVRFYVFYMMDEVEKKNGFNGDVDITALFSWFTCISESAKMRWPKDFQPNTIAKCVLKKKQERFDNGQTVYIIMKNGYKKEIRLPLEDVILTIKACLNARFVQAIKDYIALFGMEDGKTIAMYSESTRKLCEAFMACITEKICQSGYLDFETQIDLVTGNSIIKERAANNRRARDMRRHNESKKKYALTQL